MTSDFDKQSGPLTRARLVRHAGWRGLPTSNPMDRWYIAEMIRDFREEGMSNRDASERVRSFFCHVVRERREETR